MRTEILNAILDQKPVDGLTHNFYKYPARFSPRFAREIIRHFSQPGDVIYDPFVGGGTTLVEARSLGRLAIGTDINALGVFISKVKTTKLSAQDIGLLVSWTDSVTSNVSLRNQSDRPMDWIERGYQTNISSRETWPIRKSIELFLSEIENLPAERHQDFARCVLLCTAQWALDCRSVIPTATQFREQFGLNMAEMLEGITEYSQEVRANKIEQKLGRDGVLCINTSVIGAEKIRVLQKYSPSLILTSPPYPATHVLYHRWQVQGRKETKAAYWIANESDGHYAPYYCMGERRREGNEDYFENVEKAFLSLSQIARPETLVVQMVAFPDPSWQLPRYLKALRKAGFREIKKKGSDYADGRYWRPVPNRKFHAVANGTGTSNEVVLFHKLA